jgi:putative endonuclease
VTQTRRQAEARGRRAEWWAALWLVLKGYRIVSRREKTASGELDIVARKGRILAIVEVKARHSLEKGINALTWHQQQRIIRGTSSFIGQRRKFAGLDIRYDLMVIRPWRLPFHSRQAFWPEARGSQNFN